MHHQRKLNCLNIKQGDNSYYGIWCICSLLCCLDSIFGHLKVCKIKDFFTWAGGRTVTGDGAGLPPVTNAGRLHHYCFEKNSMPLYKKAKVCNFFLVFLVFLYFMVSSLRPAVRRRRIPTNTITQMRLCWFVLLSAPFRIKLAANSNLPAQGTGKGGFQASLLLVNVSNTS